jgi:cytochrome b involved in lipid metabolism
VLPLLCDPHFSLQPSIPVIMSQRFSAADVASHKTPNSLWIIVDEDVYDVTKFQDEHPGGKKSTLKSLWNTDFLFKR